MDNRKKIIIAIDGYSSTGKSSFAKDIAKKIGYIYIDTGAMYRAVTLFAQRNKFIRGKKVNSEGLTKALKGATVEFRMNEKDGKSQTWLNGECVEREIRNKKVSGKVSHISAIPEVRSFIDNILRQYGVKKGVVMDGRDIGTAVFPDAELKIFMTANENIRALRRYNELVAKGEAWTMEEVLRNLKQRDEMDQNRDTAPLRRADDAILLDNSDMTPADQMVWFEKIAKEKGIL